MNYEEREALVQTVERQIGLLLADLERRTGSYVDGLEIRTTEVTKLTSAAPEYLRCVQIDLRHLPGSHWMT